MHRAVRFLLIAILALAASSLAFAQIPTSGNVFFGYSHAQGEIAGKQPGLNGWDASLEGKFIKWVGVVADIGAQYGSSSGVSGSRYTVMFGPRVSVPVGNYTPFVHVLIGVAHENSGAGVSDTSFSDAIGGGLDYRIVKGLAARAQLDELQTRFYGTHQNHTRFGLGLVFRF